MLAAPAIRNLYKLSPHPINSTPLLQVPTRALMRLQLLPAGVLRMVYPPLPPTQGTSNGLTTSLGYDIFSGKG